MFQNKPKLLPITCFRNETWRFISNGAVLTINLIDQLVVQMVGAFYLILEKTYHLVCLLGINHLKMENVYLQKLISERTNGFFVTHTILMKVTSNHLHHLNKGLDVYLKHDNLLVFRDLNSELKDNCLNDLSNVNNLKYLNQKPTCFKNSNNPSYVDLFLTNRPRHLQLKQESLIFTSWLQQC